MNRRFRAFATGLVGLTVLILCAAQAGAQTQEIKPKPPMFTYVANWQIARANWGDMDKFNAPVNDALQKAMSDGTIVGYGTDTNLVHGPNDATHSVWWSSMSFSGAIKGLEIAKAASDIKAPALNEAKHWDAVYMSKYYNWKPGSVKGGYLHISVYKLKEDAPDDGLDDLSKHLVVPMLEKQLSDGTITAYAIFTMAVHTEAPGLFLVDYITPTPEGIDTVQTAIMNSQKEHPLGIDAFSYMTDDTAHRDGLDKLDAHFK